MSNDDLFFGECPDFRQSNISAICDLLQIDRRTYANLSLDLKIKIVQVSELAMITAHIDALRLELKDK